LQFILAAAASLCGAAGILFGVCFLIGIARRADSEDTLGMLFGSLVPGTLYGLSWLWLPMDRWLFFVAALVVLIGTPVIIGFWKAASE
jgi:hypothetical protein